MVRHVSAATLVAAGLLLLWLFPAAAQAAPPWCPDGFFVTAPGQRFALPSSVPCTDPDVGDTFTVAVATPPLHGTVAPDAGTSYYTPHAGYQGYDEFTYTATDNHGEQSAPATVQILIDTAPVCTDSTATVESGKQLTLSLPCDDADGDELTIRVDDVQHGTVDVTASGDAIYTPPAAPFVGTDTIDYYAVEDEFGLGSMFATQTITVTAPAPPAQVPPVVSQASPADTTAPAFSLTSASQKLKAVLSKGLRLVLNPSEGATATITLTVDRVTARKLGLKRNAKAPVKVGGLTKTLAGGQSTVAVKLTTKARKAIKKAAKVKLLITVVMRDAAGNRATGTMKVTLKR